MIVGRFAVTDQLRIVRFMKTQAAISLQRRIFFADLVNAGNEILQASCRMQIAVLQFILLGIQVLLAARLKRHVFAQLERRTINSIAGPQRCRQYQAHHERGPFALLEKSRKYVRRVWPQARAEELSHFRLHKLAEVLGDLFFRVAPGEISIGLGKSQLRKPVHYCRLGKCLRKEEHFGMTFLDLTDCPFPEGEWLGMRIVHSKDPHTLLDPVIENALQFLPQRAPLRALEIQRIDILIFLWRILRILYGAVRTLAEPVHMLAHVGMIRRTLIGNIDCNLKALLFCRGHEVLEIRERAEVRENGLVAALRGSDRPRAANICRLRVRRIVLTFAKFTPDWMNGRKINYIEAHG